jgi:hypothetical protein
MQIRSRREMERWLDRPLSIGVIGVDNGSPHAESGRTVLSYRDSADGKLKNETLDPLEPIRRWLLHVLPNSVGILFLNSLSLATFNKRADSS